MKIAIVGPGAMGCLFAALLSRVKDRHEIWLLDKISERAKELNKKGILVEGISRIKVNPGVTDDANKIGPCELVIIFTKSYDTEKALRSIKPLLTDETNVLSLQNGLGNIEAIADCVGEDMSIGGVTSYGATLLGIGKVRHAGKGETIIGKPTGKVFKDLRQVARLFNEAGIPVKVSKEIRSAIWSKLVINVGINALCAICRLPNGALLHYEGTRELLKQAALEAVKVAKRKRIKLSYDDPLQKVESISASTSDNICSMLQDVLRRKQTEIDYINGAIIRQGRSCGVKTPINDTLVQLVKSIESSYKRQLK